MYRSTSLFAKYYSPKRYDLTLMLTRWRAVIVCYPSYALYTM